MTDYRTLKKITPLILTMGLYHCGDKKPDNTADATGKGGIGGSTDVGGNGGGGNGGYYDSTGAGGNSGGSGGSGGSDCIQNNPGGAVEGATINNYAVEGETVDEALSDIFDSENGKGFPGENGQRFAGQTDCKLGYGVYSMKFEGPTYNEQKECCYTASVDGKPAYYKATINIPQWGGCDHCWDVMLEGLLEHEKKHADACKDIGEQLAADIASATATACNHSCNDAFTAAGDALEAKLDQLLTDATAKYKQQSKDYDTETGHGQTQGATYDPNCK